jgi:hypothetical protein
MNEFPVVKTFEEAEPFIRSGIGIAVDLTGNPDSENIQRRISELHREVCSTTLRRSAVWEPGNSCRLA